MIAKPKLDVLLPGKPGDWLPDRCPDAAKLHTLCPRGYLAWHEWAEKKAKTHRQVRCSTCGLLAVWVPKGAAA